MGGLIQLVEHQIQRDDVSTSSSLSPRTVEAPVGRETPQGLAASWVPARAPNSLAFSQTDSPLRERVGEWVGGAIAERGPKQELQREVGGAPVGGGRGPRWAGLSAAPATPPWELRSAGAAPTLRTAKGRSGLLGVPVGDLHRCPAQGSWSHPEDQGMMPLGCRSFIRSPIHVFIRVILPSWVIIIVGL